MSQVWLITGAARGLGRVIAETALEQGHRIVAAARNPERLDDLLARAPDRVRTVALDVTDAAAAQHAVDTAIDAFSRLDVLVNNAGYGHTAPFEQMPADDFRAQIETNFFGVANLTRAALPVMRTQRSGCILQISSVGGRTSTPGLSAYQAAKAAVGNFSDVVGKEVKHLGIRVCTLEPGGMRTEWASEARNGIEQVHPDYAPSVGEMLQLLARYGGHEIGDPARVAALLMDLAQRDELPARLLLGSDARAFCAASEAARRAEAARWNEATRSTDYPDSELPAELDALLP